MTSMTDVLIARGQEAVKSRASSSGQAVRDNLFEAGRGLMAARDKFPIDQDFGTWLHSSVYSSVNADERAALIKLGEYETELRPLMQGSTLTSARVIWQQQPRQRRFGLTELLSRLPISRILRQSTPRPLIPLRRLFMTTMN